MTSSNLLATAPTLDAIRDAVRRFYGGERKELVADGENTWRVARPGSDAFLLGVRVVRVRGRFRFEMVI